MSVDALQAARQGQLAAVYGYGVAAGALRGADLDRARRDLDTHRAYRDRVTSLLVDAGASPSPAAATYELEDPTETPAQARAALAGIESRLGAVYADLVAAGSGSTRELAIGALVEATVRATRWGAPVPAFPGLTERSAPSASPSPTT